MESFNVISLIVTLYDGAGVNSRKVFCCFWKNSGNLKKMSFSRKTADFFLRFTPARS